MNEPIRLLFVCSANLCRSVTAVAYAQRAVAELPSEGVSWQFESAGTDVAPDQRLPREVAEAMESLGIPFRDRPLPVSSSFVRNADIVLTAERHHRSVLAQRFPFALRYTFTLLQFARLVEAGKNDSAAKHVSTAPDLLELARIGRTSVQPLEDDAIDIPDPVAARSRSAMLNCARVVEEAVHKIVVPSVR